MAGTTNITQTRPSYTCQSITSTGPGESALNALETLQVESIAEDAIATIAPTGDFYEWVPTSVAAPGVGVVIPLGQPLLTPGRWLQITSLPPGVLYNQFVEGLPLATTLAPEYDPLVAALQQSILRFTNGVVSDGAGHTDVTLANQQVWSEDTFGAKIAMPQRARVRFAASPIPNAVPVVVTDEAATDTTLVTLHSSAASTGGITRVYDVTQQPYAAIPNNPAAAAWNTVAFMAAIAAAEADGGGGIVWIPPHAGGYYLAKNALGANADGLTSALRISGPVTLKGGGPGATTLHYSGASGAYDCVIDNAATAYTGVRVEGLKVDAASTASFGIKFRLLPYLCLEQVASTGGLSAGIALDDCFEYSVGNCDVGNAPQIGLALGAYGDAGQAGTISGLKANYFGKVGLFIQGGQGLLVSNPSIGVGSGSAIFVVGTIALSIDAPRFERNNSNPADGLVFTNFAGPTKCDVWFHRGTFSTAVPSAWTFTMDPFHPLGSGIDQYEYNNPGCIISNGSFSSTISPTASVAGNAAEGLVLSSNVHEGASAPLYGFSASPSTGFAMQWTETNNRGFLPSVSISSTLNFLWGSTNISNVCETLISGTVPTNLIPDDVLAGLTTRFLNVTNAGNGEAYYDVTGTYEGDPIFIFGGGDTPAAKGITLDLNVANAEWAGALIYLAAMVEVTALPADNHVVGSFILVGGATQAVVQGAENFVVGWQKRSQIIQLPAAGTVNIGFSKLGLSNSRFCRPVIARLGAPYSQVAKSSPSRQTKKRSMWIQPYYANVAEAYNAAGAATFCGVPVTVVNPGAPGTLATTPAQGLEVVPFAASNFLPADITMPRLEINPNLLVPNYNVNMRLTWRVVNSVADMPSNDDQAVVGFYDGSDMSGTATVGAKILRGKAGGSQVFQDYLYQNAATIIASGAVYVLDASNSGIVLDLPVPGQWQPAFYSEPATVAGSPNPSLRQCLPSTWSSALITAANLSTANARCVVGAKRAGGAAAGVKFTFPTIILEWEP